MTRPSDIPQWAWEEADRVLGDMPEVAFEAHDIRPAWEFVARALLSAYERGRGEQDYFASLVSEARKSAAKAAIKFPQPNYVTLKIAEEAGEVVRGAVHYAEHRMEWAEVEGEIIQLLAMLLRFVNEGDHVNGVIPPTAGDAMAMQKVEPA